MTDDTRSEPWWIYPPKAEQSAKKLPDPPPWRDFAGQAPEAMPEPEPEPDDIAKRRTGAHQWTGASGFRPDDLDLINAALLLRRPLLVSGPAGIGKSTLAYSIAAELNLGRVLNWTITSRSTLQHGLYHYDAIGRLQEVNLGKGGAGAAADIGRYIRLGPLGTALLPWEQPRVLLVDEIDKCDVDLPNDLLSAFEDGEYYIPELARLAADPGGPGAAHASVIKVLPMHGNERVAIENGHVRARAFPFVIMTSNGEREFPIPFLRRCIRLDLQHADEVWVRRVVARQLGSETVGEGNELIRAFLDKVNDRDQIAVNQLMNALHLVHSTRDNPGSAEKVAHKLMSALDKPTQRP
ncbi:AAA family ATPase [Dactylosporangium sp. NPDC000521]|uniref:AAA family ATPase n=1 Tax=Dactylosporangium sp. NPDC000521 TaxID=3363975 RepID=UPI00369A405D